MAITNEFLNYEGLVVYDNEIRNYIDEKTAYTESDPTVPDHVKNITTGDISNWNSKSSFSGNYDDLTNKPTFGTLAGKSEIEKTDLSADLQTAVDRVDFAAGGTMDGSLTINGDLTVNGKSTTVETYNENVNVEDNTITLRYNATTGLQNDDYTGIIAQNYDGANNGMLVFDNSGTAYVGDAGDLQPLATRAFTDSDDGALAAWDASAKTLTKAPVEVEDIVTKENVDSFNKALSTATEDNSIAYQKDVTVEKASYAEITKLGGMTYKSKNLFALPYDTASATINGVTFTINEDGSITATGTATADTNFVPVRTRSIEAGEYYFNCFTSGASNSTFMIYCETATSDGTFDKYIANNGVLTVAENRFIYVSFRVFSGYTVNTTIYPMLNKGSVALPYEPYYEGLRSAKVTEVGSVGANLFDFETWKATAATERAAVTYGDNSVTVSAIEGDAFIISEAAGVMVKGGETYTISFVESNTVIESVHYLFKNGKIDNSMKVFYGSPYTFVVDADAEYYTVRFGVSNAGSTITFSNIMLNKGPTAQPYTPYVEHTLPIPEAVRPANGINENVYDFIEWAEDRSVKKTVKCGVVDLGTLITTYSAGRFALTMPSNYKKPIDVAGRERLLCSIYDTNSSPINQAIAYVDMSISGYVADNHVYVNNSKYTDAATFKAAMSGVMLVYELAEPIVTDISDLIGDNSIGVQSNGILTFENEYNLAAPSDVVFYNEKADIVAADKLVGNLIGISMRAISDEDGNSITNTYMKKSNALEVISGLSETQLQKLISLIDTIEIQ